MKQGQSLKSILGILKLERVFRRDILIKTNCLKLTAFDGQEVLSVYTDKEQTCYLIKELVHKQLAEWINLPFRYYENIRKANPNLLTHLLNSWFAKQDDYRLLRCDDNYVKAFLSNCYLRYDNLELLSLVNTMVDSSKYLSIVSTELTEERLYIKLIDRRHKEDIGDGDSIYAGVAISNSEVCLGSIKFEPMIYRQKGKSAFIFKDQAKRIYHTDKQISKFCMGQIFNYDDITLNFEPLEANITTLIASILTEPSATKTLAMLKIRAALFTDTKDIYAKIVDDIVNTHNLSKLEKAQMYMNIMHSSDQSYLSILCALNHQFATTDYTRATELERIAGSLLISFKQEQELAA